jgi:hypothetical protein
MGGGVRGRAEDMTGSAVGDLKASTGPAPNASCPITQTTGSPGSRGKTIMWGMPAARQNGSSKRNATFSTNCPIDRRAGQVNRVQPATDPVTGLHHDAPNASVRKSIRDGQSRDPRTDYHHVLDRPRQAAGGICPPVVKVLSSHRGHPTTSANLPRYQREHGSLGRATAGS